MLTESDKSELLSGGAQRLVKKTLELKQTLSDPDLGAYHWLLTLLDWHGAMVESLAKGVDAQMLRDQVQGQLAAGNAAGHLSATIVISEAFANASARGGTKANERDIARVVLTYLHFPLASNEGISDAEKGTKSSLAASPFPNPPDPKEQLNYQPSPIGVTPTLEQFGRDLTRQAQEGKLSPVVGRETEIQLVVETLCRRTKRNPILIGPPGVGKTAIVEGLAQLIVAGDVPEMLRGSRLLAIQPSNLVAGTSFRGDFEQRMEAVIQEASQDGILLFLDEVHSMIGAGGSTGTSDVASLLKPTLARGDIACIAATTDDEYRLYIEP